MLSLRQFLHNCPIETVKKILRDIDVMFLNLSDKFLIIMSFLSYNYEQLCNLNIVDIPLSQLCCYFLSEEDFLKLAEILIHQIYYKLEHAY
jgi:hypothetical protein